MAQDPLAFLGPLGQAQLAPIERTLTRGRARGRRAIETGAALKGFTASPSATAGAIGGLNEAYLNALSQAVGQISGVEAGRRFATGERVAGQEFQIGQLLPAQTAASKELTQFQMDLSKPGFWDYLLSGIGAAGQAATGVGALLAPGVGTVAAALPKPKAKGR